MCTRTNVRTFRGIEVETTQISGEEDRTFLSPLQARELAARLQDDYDGPIPEPQMYIHPTTGDEVLEVWTSMFDSHIYHLNDEGYYNVTELGWDD